MSSTSERPLVTVVVLDHGSPTLLDCLAAVERAAAALGTDLVERFVVSDADHLPLPLREVEHTYPDLTVKVVPSSTHPAALADYAVSLGRGGLVALLDSTALVDESFLVKTKPYAAKVNLLGLAPAVFLTRSPHTGAREEPLLSKVIVDDRGLPAVLTGLEAPSPSLACFAGFAVYHRSALRAVGGFDEKAGRLYDLDLCYRGWGRGFGVLHEPGMVMRVVAVPGRPAAFRPLGLGADWPLPRRFGLRVLWRRFLYASGLHRGLPWRPPTDPLAVLADTAGWVAALLDGRRYGLGVVTPERLRAIVAKDRLEGAA